MNTYNSVLAYEAQQSYCREKKYPLFAPSRTCWRCHRNIYQKIKMPNKNYETGISVEYASGNLITGCPHCNWSFCD